MSSSAIKVVMPGKGEVTLRPTDHLATGGEGAVYLKNNRIFKLFLNPERARASGMADKIQMLSQIRHPFIVAPLDVLYDGQHQMVGYYMEKAEGIALMKTFTNTWRDLNAFTNVESIKLVENMREAVLAAHALKAVMVDGNETNYLVVGTEPRIIDVDSWKIGRHGGTAIMPSIRDYHRADHDEKTDWFAWGVVSFQVFTGIHPYKGTHPAFKKSDLEGRMRANASVFDKEVRLNTAVRDFSCVPGPLLDWYEGVFAKGERSAPPSALLSQAPAALTKKVRVIQTASGKVRHDRVHGFAGKVRHVSANGIAFYGDLGALKAHDLYRKQGIPSLSTADIDGLFANQAALVRQGDSFVYVTLSSEGVQGRVVPGERDPQPANVHTNLLPFAAAKLLVIGNRLFALNPQSDRGMVELEVSSMGSRMVVAVKAQWPVNVLSTRFFDGFGAMDCLGVPFLVVPEQESLTIQRAAVLAGYKLINGFSRGSNYVWVHGVSRADGQIYRLELRANSKEFELVHSEVVDEAELNLAVSAKGIAVGIFEDGTVSVQNTLGAGGKLVPDGSVNKEMSLFNLPDGIHYYRDADVYRMSLS
jgi:hypothetical protein